MLLTLNGEASTRARVTIPVAGRWHARVMLPEGAAPTGRVTLEATGLTLSGTVVRSGVFRGDSTTLVVGGAGGVGKDVIARAYAAPTAKHVLEDLLRDAGETLSSSASDASLLARVFARWSRAAGPATRALELLCAALGAPWRVLDDGSFAVGAPSWPETSWTGDVLDEAPAEGRSLLVAENASLRPGTTLLGRRVALVEYSFASGSFRTEVEYS